MYTSEEKKKFVDVKTICESSQAQVINQQYLQEYLSGKNLSTYLMARNFIQSVLNRIYEEIKEQINTLRMQIDDNTKMKSIFLFR